ncbi:MAG: hypothetical protein LQ344_005409 [Seirophora lacunosa]|nr:MAG: hypothetical protein LQ344_005409 [Seirophora lacunosa]
MSALQHKSDTPAIAGTNGLTKAVQENQSDRELLATNESPVTNEARRDTSHQAPLFHATLPKWGLGPQRHAAIYNYYKHLGRREDEGTTPDPESNASLLREILEDDACARHEDGAKVTRWINKKEIARGSFAKVYLWEKKTLDRGPPLRMAVKDSETSLFWQDYHAEGALIKQLNERGCENVITVLDWIYKPASATQKAFVRTCYEYAEHIDLSIIAHFYAQRQLLLPESFIWHVFWSTANALCYCRHGTNKSDETIPGWDTIVHGDVKPGNLLLAAADDNVNWLYPTVKLGDFGVAYNMSESNPHLRAWKSTFQYGTRGYWAPEVESVNAKQTGIFRPVAASRVHGSHSDIYSLGAVIESMMNIRFHAFKDHPDFDNPRVVDYYSPELRDLAKACRRTSIHSRPAIYDVYIQTCGAMARWRDAAFAEADLAGEGRPFHSQVLFRKEDQARFDNDHAFRHGFRKVNRGRLLRGKETTAPPPIRSTGNHLLSAKSTESLQNKIQAAWAAGDITSPVDPPAAADDDHETLFPASAFKLPGFSAAVAVPKESRHSSPAPPPQPQPQPNKPSPTIFSSLDQRVRAAWRASNLASAFTIPKTQQPTTPTTLVASPLSQGHTPVFHPASPSPSILAPPSPPSVPTETKNRSASPLPQQQQQQKTANKKRPAAAAEQTLGEQQQQQQQPKKKKQKISRFVEHLPENAERVAAAKTMPPRRSLRRMGALKGKERRVRFVVDGDGDGVEG